MSNCKSCGQEIVWRETDEGRFIPMNKNGTCHFETCPQRTQWKNKTKLKQEDHIAHLETADSKQTRLKEL